MKRCLFSHLGLSLLATSLQAGPTALTPVSTASSHEPDLFITPTFDARVRYEYRNVDPLDDAHALTARARLGLLTREVAGFSAFGEVEATAALIDDYRSNPADNSTSPSVAGNTVVGDPENLEINQAWLRFRGGEISAKVGRQRIIRHNAALIAHVGWRQNEQTYDAASLEWAREELTVFYAYSPRALRVFGNDANDAPPGPPLRDFEGDFHFLDATLRNDAITISAYAYLLDVDNNDNVGRSNSFGGFFDGRHVRAEVAWQDGRSALAGGHYGSGYAHLTLEAPLGSGTASAGFEYLQEHFKTPFALLHAFNGLADNFVQQRAGLNDADGMFNGLTDVYLGYVQPGLPLDLTAKAYAHWFLDDVLATTYGYEFDFILAKQISENLSAIGSAAWFIGEDVFPDVAQVTLQFDYRF